MFNEVQEKSRVTKCEEQKKKLAKSAQNNRRKQTERMRNKLLGEEDRRVLEDRAARELAEKFAYHALFRFAGRKDKIRVSVGGFGDPIDWEIQFRVEGLPYKAVSNNAPPISGEDFKLYLDKLEDELRRDPSIDERFRDESKRVRAKEDEIAAKNAATLKAFLKSSKLPERVKIRDLLKD